MAKEIVLSNGMVCTVDDYNYEWLMQWKWTATYFCRGKGKRSDKTKWYACRWESAEGHYRIKKGPNKGKLRKNQRKIYMHRQIAKTKTKAHHVTDHIDSNGLNNQEHNLRNCTQRTNCYNRKETVDAVAWA